MGTLRLPFTECRRERLPAGLFGERRHTHTGLDDARGYALLLRSLLSRDWGRGLNHRPHRDSL
jgi:hypothetical protein